MDATSNSVSTEESVVEARPKNERRRDEVVEANIYVCVAAASLRLGGKAAKVTKNCQIQEKLIMTRALPRTIGGG